MNYKLPELSAFLAVAEHRSFQRAALAKGITRSGVSHAIKSLENTLGVLLIQRNTRSVSLTEAGQMLYERLKPAFYGIGQALEDLNQFRGSPFGTLKISVPRSIGRLILKPIIARLLAENPGLSVELSANDALVDIVAEGYDAGIRFGERLQMDMIATRINMNVTFAVVGSPGYIKSHGLPATPQGLLDHACVRYRFPSGVLFPWEFEKAGHEVAIDVSGPISLDDQDLMVEAALAGAGLAYVFHESVADLIAEGRLIRCLDDWCPTLSSIYLYYTNRSHQSASLKALIALLQKTPPKA